jgi:hypothetical protein
MESIGFAYLGRYWYTKPLGAESTGVVSLPVTSHRDDPAVYVTPGLGVRHERLERLIAELCGKPQDKFLPSSIGTSLVRLTNMNEHGLPSLHPAPNIQGQIAELVSVIYDYGFKWMKENATLDAILQGSLEFRYSWRDHARFRIPAIYYLKGDQDSASFWIERGLAEVGPDENIYADQYRRFAKGLLDRLGSPSEQPTSR